MLAMCFNEGLRQFRLVDPQTFKPEPLIDLLREMVSEPHEESMPIAATGSRRSRERRSKAKISEPITT